MDTVVASEPNDGAKPVESAIRHVPSLVRFFGVAAGLLVLDLWSKQWVFHTLAPTERRSLIEHVIELRRSLNDGAVFGSFTGHVGLFVVASLFALAFVFYLFAGSRPTHRFLHIALACILAGAIGNLYDRTVVTADVVTYQTEVGTENTFVGKIVSVPGAATLRIGYWPEGARPQSFVAAKVSVHQQGVVRDFIKFVPRFPAWLPWLGTRDVWPWVFNIADAALVCGVGIMLLACWPGRKLQAESAPPDAPGA